jgi:hypothetical protein
LTIWVGRTWQTKRLGTMPALVEKCPSRLILVLMALRPGFTRCRIMLRSNSERRRRVSGPNLAALADRHHCEGLNILSYPEDGLYLVLAPNIDHREALPGSGAGSRLGLQRATLRGDAGCRLCVIAL